MWIGKTIAVLGNGPKVIFPLENTEIYTEIIKKGGAIISEYPDVTKPQSEYFRRRNRIVSGLSLGVLIVEAELRSGTSITARYAREQGKDVFCIPNARGNGKGIGTNIQIQKGAKLVLEPSEIIEKYTGHTIEQISIEDIQKANKSKVDLKAIKPEYREIYQILEKPQSINDLKIKNKIKISDLYQILFMMELEDLIEIKQNKYRRKNIWTKNN